MLRIAAFLAAMAITPAAAQTYSSALRGMAKQVYDGVNEIRTKHDLLKLKWDDQLAAMARDHALRMAAYRFFSHEDPELGDLKPRLQRHHVIHWAAGENLFMSQGYDDPVPEAVKQWMDSPGHRRNILDRVFTHTGVGAAMSADGHLYFVQVFALPRRATRSSSR